MPGLPRARAQVDVFVIGRSIRFVEAGQDVEQAPSNQQECTRTEVDFAFEVVLGCRRIVVPAVAVARTIRPHHRSGFLQFPTREHQLAADNAGSRVSPGSVNQRSNAPREQLHVAVDEHQKLPGGLPSADVGRGGEPEVVEVANNDGAGYAGKKTRGIIRRCVVDYDDLTAHIVLETERFQATKRELGAVPENDHNRHLWRGGSAKIEPAA